MLRNKILERKPGIITYGITPPKKDNPEEKIIEISRRHIERLRNLNIDGLVIYDIQDEGDRTKEVRPFPFFETLASDEYSDKYLSELKIPKIIYKCVGKYSKDQLGNWLRLQSDQEGFSVFVGAASSNQAVSLKLNDAYELNHQISSKLLLGGVTIPERHGKNNDEHLRLISKYSKGCSYFISQAVYNVEIAKNFLSDYYYYCRNNNIPMVPVLFTLTPCGSLKTLEFMKWLGINIPRWLENELIHSNDILDRSIDILKKQYSELLEFSMIKQIPIGCNIESVSIRKVEIDASIALVGEIQKMIHVDKSALSPTIP